MPELTAVRVLSGARTATSDEKASDEFEWGLPAVSDYNPPGKKWEQYRDQPGRPLEAMGWCVETQTSWTAENPMLDPGVSESSSLGLPEDEFHLEPVLVRKKSLYGNPSENTQYPVDWQGNDIWRNTENVVAAVVKIHFMPGTLRMRRPFDQDRRRIGPKPWFRTVDFMVQRKALQGEQRLCPPATPELRNPGS